MGKEKILKLFMEMIITCQKVWSDDLKGKGRAEVQVKERGTKITNQKCQITVEPLKTHHLF